MTLIPSSRKNSLSSSRISMFQCSLGACTLGKCCFLALDTQCFSIRCAGVQKPGRPEQCKSQLPDVHFQDMVFPGSMQGWWRTADSSSRQRLKMDSFSKCIFFLHVLSTLIMPFAPLPTPFYKSWLTIYLIFFLVLLFLFLFSLTFSIFLFSSFSFSENMFH